MSKPLRHNPAALVNHPDLDRVRMVEDCARHMAENAGSDEARQECAADRREEWAAFVESIRDHGVIEPIKLLAGTNQIIDGRHRNAAAIAAGREWVPCVTVTQAEADAIIDSSVAGRRHWTKSMRAYFAVLRHPEVLEVKPGGDRQSKKHSAQNAEWSADELAVRFGVSTRLIEHAIKFVRETARKPKLRDRLELSIFAGMSLGGVLSGLGGAEATAGKPKAPPRAFAAYRSLATLRNQLGDFAEWPAEQRDLFADEWNATWAALPAEARALMLDTIDEHIGGRRAE